MRVIGMGGLHYVIFLSKIYAVHVRHCMYVGLYRRIIVTMKNGDIFSLHNDIVNYTDNVYTIHMITITIVGV